MGSDSPVDPLPYIVHRRYDAVGVCIYCGARSNLTDEHIMPLGFGGNLILPEAPCEACARVTSEDERKVLRGALWPIRVYRSIKSRRKHEYAPRKLPLEARFGDDWTTVHLPYDEYPLMLNFTVFGLPGAMDPDYERGLTAKGSLAFNFGTTPDDALESMGADQIRVREEHDPFAYARMTAKVGYGMAVAIGVIDPKVARPPVVEAILQRNDDIGRWFGSSPEPVRKDPRALHFVSVGRDETHGFLVARVQYLTDTGTPIYLVVLGTLDAEYLTALARCH